MKFRDFCRIYTGIHQLAQDLLDLLLAWEENQTGLIALDKLAYGVHNGGVQFPIWHFNGETLEGPSSLSTMHPFAIKMPELCRHLLAECCSRAHYHKVSVLSYIQEQLPEQSIPHVGLHLVHFIADDSLSLIHI